MRIALVIVCLLLAQVGFSQTEDPAKQNIIEQRIEIIAEQFEDEDIDFTTLFDELSYYYDNPLNLNIATDEQLASLFLLTDKQIADLLQHRNKYGRILSIYELQFIYGFDVPTLRMIEPFVTVGEITAREITPVGKRFKYGRSELFLRYQRVLEEMDGYTPISDSALAASPNSRYNGSPDRMYMRYRYRYRDNLSIGLTAEKDAGEQFFGEYQPYGFDFYSAHLYLKDVGPVSKLIVGDYQAQFGQGLTLWSGLAFGKSAIIRGMKKRGVGLKPYTSVDENLFLRGAGATLNFKKLEFTVLGSRKRIDGNVTVDADTSELLDETVITSFQQTGYHRTPGEVADRDAVVETDMGAHVSYKTERMEVGVSGLYTKFDVNLEQSSQLYRKFTFSGNENYKVGADYNAFAGPFHVFGEVAMSQSGGVANLHGVSAELDSKLRMLVIHRNYSKDYQTLIGNGFGEGANTNNEIGTMVAIEAKLHKTVDIAAYTDFYRWDWMGYQRDGLGNGQDHLIQVNFKPNRRTYFYTRYKWEGKPRNLNDTEPGIDIPAVESRQQLRFHGETRVRNVKFRSRFEWIGFQPNDGEMEHGYMVFQDIIWTAEKQPLKVALRYALFNTDSYDARIYAYENDVLYAFSVPAYFYRGSRAYITLKYSPVRKIDMWLRWGQFFYADRNEISSGLNRIDGNTKTEVKAQIRLKF